MQTPRSGSPLSSQSHAHLTQQLDLAGLRRAGKYVVLGGDDRPDRRPPPPRTPRAAASICRGRYPPGGAFIQEIAGAFCFVCNQCAHRCARGGRGEIRFLDVKALHVLGGQVDAVAAEVLGHVLQVFDDLKCGTDRVGQPDPLGGLGAGDAEDQAADGVGGQLAVGEEVVVGLVAGDELVLAVRGDQAEEGLGGQRAAADGGLEAAQQGVARGAVEDAVEVGLEGVEEDQAVLGLRGCNAEQPGVGAAGARSPSPMSSTRRANPYTAMRSVRQALGRKKGATGKFSPAALSSVPRSGSPVAAMPLPVTARCQGRGRRMLR